MNPNEAINIFRTKTGKLTLTIIVFAVLMAGIGIYNSRHQNAHEVNPVKSVTLDLPTSKPQVVQTIQKPMEVFRPPAPKPDPLPSGQTNAAPVPVIVVKTNLPPISPPTPTLPLTLFADNSPPELKTLSPYYAPFGRLIPCETVITVDSASIQTPIIGLVTEDIYHAGRLIIPAGTEVHGTAQRDRTRERISSGSSWTLVWQTGEELHLKGIALDREFSSNQEGWGITDGSAGLRGRVIKTDDLGEIKLFAATFLSGAASALTEKQYTVFGTTETASLNNAPFKGAQEVLKTYAQRIYETIQRDGFYVRVSSGKQFYLYVMQTIDRAEAQVGGGDTPFGQSGSAASPLDDNLITAQSRTTFISNPEPKP